MTLHAYLVPVLDLSPSQVSAWQALAARAAEPNPFFEPQWVLPTARHSGVAMHLLFVMAGIDMVVCIPLFSHGRIGGVLRIRPWSVPSVLATPLVDPTYTRAAFAAAVAHLLERRGAPYWLVVPWLAAFGAAAGPFTTALAGLQPRWMHDSESSRPWLIRRLDATYLDNTMSSQRWRAVGRRRRSLERSLGDVVTVVERQCDDTAVEKYLAMEAQGWKGRSGTAMRSIPGRAQFFREMCGRFGIDGRLRMFTLEAGGATLAMQCDVLAGGGVFCLKKTFDQDLSRFSPGLYLEIERVRMFHEGSATWMDSCLNAPNDPLFWLWPDSKVFRHVQAPLAGAVGWAARHAPVALMELRSRLRRPWNR